MSECVPVVRIRPPAPWEALDLSAVWRFRDLLWAFAVRDIKLRYRQTVLGVLWVVLQPLAGAGIFAFVFGRVAGLSAGGNSYLLFTYFGLLAWNLFSGVAVKAANSLVGNASMVSKIAFPRLVLPLSAAIGGILDFGIGCVAGLVLLIFHGVVPGLSVLLAPIWLVLAVILAVAVGLIAGALAVSYRDVIHILPVGLQFLLYASPVGYTIAVVPEGLPRLLFLLNPLATFLDCFRGAVLGTNVTVPSYATPYAVAVTLVLFVGGLFYFRRSERQFADVI